MGLKKAVRQRAKARAWKYPGINAWKLRSRRKGEPFGFHAERLDGMGPNICFKTLIMGPMFYVLLIMCPMFYLLLIMCPMFILYAMIIIYLFLGHAFIN